MGMQNLLKYKEDNRAVVIAIISPLLIMLFIFWDTSIFAINAIVWILLWIITCRNNYILHNHIHVPMFKGNVSNKILDILLALSTGMPAGNWKIMHVHGHHVDNKVQTLASRSFVKDFTVPSYEKIKWHNGIIFSLFRIPRQFFHPLKQLVFWQWSSWASKRTWARYYLLDYAILTIFLVILSMYNFERVFFGIIPIYILVHFVSIYIDFYTHVRESDDINSGIPYSNVCHNTAYNKFFWNFGFHVGHHANPRAHWSKLPDVEREMGVVSTDKNAFSALNIFGLLRPIFNKWRIPVWHQEKK